MITKSIINSIVQTSVLMTVQTSVVMTVQTNVLRLYIVNLYIYIYILYKNHSEL